MALKKINDAAAAAPPVGWWWDLRARTGALTLLEGFGGEGKSAITRNLIARASRGRQMPFDEAIRSPSGAVILASAEENIGDIRGQLAADRADLDRILIDDGRPRPLTLPRDLHVLDRAVEQVGAGVVNLEPLIERVPDAARSEKAVRAALTEITTWAAYRKIPIVATRHWDKAGRGPQKSRGLGSSAIGYYAREILCTMPDPRAKDQHQRLLLECKQHEAETLVYRTVKRDGAVVVEWLDAWMGDARDLTGTLDHRQLALAMRVLREELRDEPRPSSEIKKAMSSVSVSAATASRAKAIMEILHVKIGATWWTYTPDQQHIIDDMRRVRNLPPDDDDDDDDDWPHGDPLPVDPTPAPVTAPSPVGASG
jgi:hypothetical protein